MMSGAEQAFDLWTGAGWTAAALPYSGGGASMVLVIPDAGTFDAFEGGLTADLVAQVLAPAGPVTATVVLPRFRFATQANLKALLSALGMADAFGPAADFSGIDGGMDLRMSAVHHQAVVAVDEAGTTAVAATGVVFNRKSTVLAAQNLIVDRPFLFFIVHQATGAILFEGRVLDPNLDH
jgi:serpin B